VIRILTDAHCVSTITYADTGIAKTMPDFVEDDFLGRGEKLHRKDSVSIFTKTPICKAYQHIFMFHAPSYIRGMP
jgi:hypothetical protein